MRMEEYLLLYLEIGEWDVPRASAHVLVSCRHLHGDPPCVSSVLASGGFRVQCYWTVRQQCQYDK